MAVLRRFLPYLVCAPFVAALAACGGSSPNNDVFSNPPPAEETGADAGSPPQASLKVVTNGALTTSESGGRATFTVALGVRPIADVLVPITSMNEGEIKVEPTALSFTPDNWDKPQTVTLIGQDDAIDDGDKQVVIQLGPTQSADLTFNGFKGEPLDARNTDDDVAGIDVSMPSPSNNVTETGGEATFTVKLKAQPTADVTIAVSSSKVGEGKVDPAQLVFTTQNWQTAQTVKVTGQDDSVADGDQAFNVVLAKPTTNDGLYAALAAIEVPFQNLDDDTPGFFVFPPAPGARTTTEAGGTTTFSVRLRSKPAADVTIPVSSSKPGEALPSVTELVFTPLDYDQAQTVTVTGQNDDVDDGDQTYKIVLGAVTSTDASYNGLQPTGIDLTNTDDDTAAVLVGTPSGTSTGEDGTAITFKVKLASQPTASVTIGVSSNKTGEGQPDVTQLVFDAADWSTEKTVTVTGQDDLVDDGNQSYKIVLAQATSTDPKYAAIDPADVSLTNVDNDTAGVFVSAPYTSSSTTETGGTVKVDVKLQTQPTGDVTIPVSVSNTNEAQVDKTTLTFTTSNWNTAQTITVTGKDDFVDDGDVSYNLVLGTATGGGYNIDPADVALTNIDNDTAGVTVSAPTPTAQTTEAGGTAKVDVKLNSQPTGNVTIAVSVSNTNEATVDKAMLTFTTSNWNVNQTITVTGKDDSVDDGDVAYTLVLGTASGGGYGAINPPDVSLTNLDDDTAGVNVSAPYTSSHTTEAGGFVKVDVKLKSQPTADVTIPVSVSDTNEATIDKTSLTFTTLNWNVNQTITVTGKDDFVDDGDVSYSLVLGAATGGDYAGMDPADVSLTNDDNDTAGVTVSAPNPSNMTTETGTAVTVTVKLDTKPTGDVTIPVSVSNANEATVDVALLTFTTDNWNVMQTITVTGIDDGVLDGDASYSLVLDACTGGGYTGIDPADVSLVNKDDGVHP